MNDTKDILDIDFWVMNAADSAVKRFYPTVIAKELALPINIVFDKLVAMVKENKLTLLWEVLCPECYRSCGIGETHAAKINQDCECIIGHEFIVSVDNVYPVFEITDYYKTKVRSNKKKVAQRSLVMV